MKSWRKWVLVFYLPIQPKNISHSPKKDALPWAAKVRHISRVQNPLSVNLLIYTGNLVGGLEHFLFFHILGIIIPTD